MRINNEAPLLEQFIQQPHSREGGSALMLAQSPSRASGETA
jgi:hypothetical protein